MDFKLYQFPKVPPKGESVILLVRILFIISLSIILWLVIRYNRIYTDLTAHSEYVEVTQQSIMLLSDLSIQLYKIEVYRASANPKEDLLANSEYQEAVLKLPVIFSKLEVIAMGANLDVTKYFNLRNEVESTIGDVFMTNNRIRIIQNKTTGKQIRSIIEKVEDLRLEDEKALEERLVRRNIYKSQIANYNWMIFITTILFMLGVFYLLDRELVRNKKYRIDLENKVENLNRSNTELEQFAYSASHDLQEPLRKIRSFSDRIFVKHKHEVNANVMGLLERISTSAERMQLLIVDLLSYSQLVMNDSAKQLVPLNKVLKEVLATLSLKISEKGAVITYDDLPPIMGYSSQLNQLFQNLIDNSLKYSKDNQSVEISITYQEAKGIEIEDCMPAHKSLSFHSISVIDNGIGFSDDQVERIFGMFQRLHSKNTYTGTGIGLAISKRVVSNHEGYIRAKGIRNLGASFTIYFPIYTIGS